MPSERYAVAGDYLIRFKAKPPGAVLAYDVDFGLQLIDETPATILGVVWSVVGLPGDARPLVIEAQTYELGLASLLLSGGSPLQSYDVRGQVSWSDGETDVVSLVLPIAYMPNEAVLFPPSITTGELFGLPTVTVA